MTGMEAITVNGLQNERYLVMGLGLTGYSAARYLLANGYQCRVHDTRDIPPYLKQLKAEFPQVVVSSNGIDADLMKWADTLVVSPGISIHLGDVKQAADLGKKIIGDIELFVQLARQPIVAITGSNGKSTVSTMIAKVIGDAGYQVGLGGNIGTPALDLLADPVDYYVLEVSSYQLETTYSLRAKVAVLLNLSEDHMDRYQNYQDYIHAKLRIYDNAEVCISNADDELSWHDDGDVRFSLQPDSDAEFRLNEISGKSWLCHNEAPWIDVDELLLGGRHNWANCLAVMAIASRLGISPGVISESLKTFGGIPHRSQLVATINNVQWVNDSKATNVGAAVASIEGRDRPIVLIAGGQSKGADMSVMIPVLRDHVRLVLLMGEDANLLEAAWQGSCTIERVDDMVMAVDRANELAHPGDCVLLAPACASFDMYEKFEARGDHFTALVHALEGDHE